VLLLAVLAAAFAPAPFPKARSQGDASDADLKALQGTWETVSLDLEGLGAAARPGDVTTIDRRRMICISRGVEGARWTVRLDATKRPKTLDLINGDKVVRCIYRLEGGALTICFSNRFGGERPAAFRGDEGVGLEVLRRARR
jgi:uncharacterized protein (TIGR03067 family)